ncbi:hypothetical protein JXQ31_10515 [candidate division KSB1 bacterium]|nr:hypothetical protein [candidate division KSB1 bacterium]
MKKNILKIMLGTIVGGILGFGYYYFIGCKTGTCPITGNPYISLIYGAGMGLLLTLPSSQKSIEKK